MPEMLDKVELQGGCLAYFPLQRSKAATQHCSLHRRNGCHEVSRCIKYFEDNSATYQVQEVHVFMFWTLCCGPLGPCFLYILPVRSQWDRRKARATSCNRLCKWLLRRRDKIQCSPVEPPPKKDPQHQEPRFKFKNLSLHMTSKKINAETLTATRTSAICFALRSAGFW